MALTQKAQNGGEDR